MTSAALAREHKVFIERRLQRSSVGKAQNRVGLRYGVGHADTRLRLAGNRQTVVKVSTDADVEEPFLERDLVLNIERQLLHIGVPVEGEQASAAGQIVRQQRRVESASGVRIIGRESRV